MSATGSFKCGRCDEWHAGPPFAYGAPAPEYWRDTMTGTAGCELHQEQCVINDADFFVRATIQLPVRDIDGVFEWGVWVSLSRESFVRMAEVWDTPGREAEPAYFGWLSTGLPGYTPTTLNLKTNVWTRPVGQRPTVELEPTSHPLAVEQRDGITVERVQQIAQLVRHG